MKKFYKGFNEDLTCRGFQYEEGKTYEENEASLCHKGFHACEDPLDCFNYYTPASSQFREVILDGISDQREDDSKVCAKKITIGARLNFSEMVKAAFEFRWSKTTLEPGSSATGENGAASATGENGAASATGTRGAASATGENGAASATGTRGAASATGE
ncbi:MAG: collagen-like protein, partial [Eggerthellaceae bacterium]|nr:collagen-like protein [Eggerthellaceae bacterium]